VNPQGRTHEAFPYCLPLVVVDARHLKSKYEGMLMTASAMDGEKSIVPIALAVVPGENEASRTYFFRKLKQSMPGIDDASIVIVSDREKGLCKAIRNVLPNAIPGVCVWHLEKIVSKNSRQSLKEGSGQLLKRKTMLITKRL
jgi:zinc finger SWIM domain-containing protein 3